MEYCTHVASAHPPVVKHTSHPVGKGWMDNSQTLQQDNLLHNLCPMVHWWQKKGKKVQIWSLNSEQLKHMTHLILLKSKFFIAAEAELISATWTISEALGFVMFNAATFVSLKLLKLALRKGKWPQLLQCQHSLTRKACILYCLWTNTH